MDKYYISGVTVVNALIFLSSAWLCVFNYRKCYKEELPSKDQSFYSLKLIQSILFLIFNGVATYVNVSAFYFAKINLPSDLIFLRYVDRGVVAMFAFIFFLDCFFYKPSSYKSN
jgi:hypothetical protein